MAVCKRCDGLRIISCMACFNEHISVYDCDEPEVCPMCKGSGQETGSPVAGKPDEKIAKCVFNGKSEAMIIRNSVQTVYIPYMNDTISSMFRKVNSVIVIVIEKENYNMKEIIDVIQNEKFLFFSEKYKIKVENINNPLPLPEHEKSRLKAQLK